MISGTITWLSLALMSKVSTSFDFSLSVEVKAPRLECDLESSGVRECYLKSLRL
jgi:hypothetical protein